MLETHEYYELSIYSPTTNNTYRLNKRIFDTHKEGLNWAIENYGWTDALYSGQYINEDEDEDEVKSKELEYLSEDEVKTIGAQAVSDLEVLMEKLEDFN